MLDLSQKAEKLLSLKTQCGGQSYYYVHNCKRKKTKHFAPVRMRKAIQLARVRPAELLLLVMRGLSVHIEKKNRKQTKNPQAV